MQAIMAGKNVCRLFTTAKALGVKRRICNTLQRNLMCRYNSTNEIDKAKQAKSKRPMVTIFDQIINREIPAKIVYEDEVCLAFEDANPQAPTHMLLIPKKRIPMIGDAVDSDKELLGYLMLIASKLGNVSLKNGYRLVINNGPDGCQTIYHMHIHILGGRQLLWPPG